MPGSNELSCAVVIVCHNYGRFLGEAIESVLRQTATATEILVILDDCRDNSQEVARRYPVQTTSTNGCDPYLSRRLGARATVSEVVCFLDADDRLSEDYIEAGLPAFADPRVGIVTGVVEFFGQRRGRWEPQWRSDIETVCGATSAALVRREAIRRSGCFEDFSLIHRASEDWELWKRIVRDGWSIAPAPIVHHHRKHADNRTKGRLYWETGDRERREIGGTTPMMGSPASPHLPPLKLGFVSPSLGLGGVETMAASQIAYAEHLNWVGVCDPVGVHRSPEITGRMPPLYGGPQGLKRMVDRSDMIYTWAGPREIIEETRRLAGNKPIIYGVHGQGDWTSRLVEAAADLCDVFWCVSMGAVLAIPPAHRHKARLIHGGVDLKLLAGGRGREAVRRAWGLQSGELAVGYVGRLSDEKNPLVIAEAVARMPEARLICCAPPSRDPNDTILNEMRRILPNRFVRFQSDPAGVGEVYRGLDCLVVSSHEEGMPTVTLEAWAIGVPVVSTPVGLLLELEPRFGPLAEALPMDPLPADVAGAIRRAVLENESRLTTARELAINELNITRMIREFERLACELVESRPARVQAAPVVTPMPAPRRLLGGLAGGGARARRK